MNKTAQNWIDNLNLLPLAEGGYFNRYFTSQQIIPKNILEKFSGDRHSATKIYYLLEEGQLSVFHKIKQEEVWDFMYGDPLELVLLSPLTGLSNILLGSDPDLGTVLSYTVSADTWMAAHSLGDYTLLTCTCSPGFDDDDYTLATRETLSNQFPEHAEIIKFFTKL
ncbi:MAG: cupin domain-containing protein [bacterium]